MRKLSTLLVIRGIEIKTMSYHFILTRVAIIIIILKSRHKYWWGCGRVGTVVHCWWECKKVRPLGKTMFSSSKTQTKVNIGSSNFSPRYISQRIENRFSYKYLYMNVWSCITHNSQKADTTQMAINPQTNKQNCGISIQWPISQLWKEVRPWYISRCGWISETLC